MEKLGVPEEELSCRREEWPRCCGFLFPELPEQSYDISTPHHDVASQLFIIFSLRTKSYHHNDLLLLPVLICITLRPLKALSTNRITLDLHAWMTFTPISHGRKVRIYCHMREDTSFGESQNHFNLMGMVPYRNGSKGM
ncbi:hypothetical protein DY000_02012710 [Brassica cretica]|uniref:Uncharacterized protein n=1 Tax=Brassica cretica TaxID=69181 RepID=A0ABQ7CVE8_BRACR|nr:hypothetical protein DY000_02012710 [Brassica cretica]